MQIDNIIEIYRSDFIGCRDLVNCNTYFDDYQSIIENLLRDNMYVRISKLNVFYTEERIIGIDTDYISASGQEYTTGAHVGSALKELPFMKCSIKLGELEQIQHISGTYDEFGITQLNIYTNQDKKFSFGVAKGQKFQSEPQFIVKAFGGSNIDYLQSLWFYYGETDDVLVRKSQTKEAQKDKGADSDEYIILDDPQDFKQEGQVNLLIKRYQGQDYPRIASFAGYIDSCLDFWDDLYERINLASLYPVGTRTKVTKIEVGYNKKHVLSLKFHYNVGGINIEGIEHGNNIKETNNLLKTISKQIESKSDSFTIPDKDDLKSILVRFDEDQNMTYLRVTTLLNKFKAWPSDYNEGQKFKIYFNCDNTVKFQGFCGGMFGNFLRSFSFLYYIGEPRLFKPKNQSKSQG
eukprot:TRINITY_DN2821_c0_g1_i1.p1 TRINITY_DN2821_c0_g1~~TRINITY_DN2821_c0_g1_i1.p1  ORF type:complete len:406 (+),score=16.10 TRINITY_DN2821_c0_g1_i1:2-1219(+)